VTLTILIPRIKAPDAKDSITIQLKNICNKIKENQNLKIVWIIFQPEKIRETKDDNFEIINFHDYKNAFEIIDKVRPDAILVEGSMDFQNVAFVMAGKFRKIPTITTFFRYLYVKNALSKLTTFKSRINQVISYPPPTGDYEKGKIKKNRGLRFFLKKFFFLYRTLKQVYSNNIALTRFILFYIKLMSSKYIPIDKSLLGNLNLCSNTEWSNRLQNIGCNKSTISIVGNTEFDDLFNAIQNFGLSFRNSENKIRVLLCATALHEHGLIRKEDEFKKIVNAINVLLKQSKFSVALKIHPSSSSLEEYREVEKNLIKNIPIYHQENLIELILNHDVILNYGFSTVILYSALLKKPTVILDLFEPKVRISGFFDNDSMIKCSEITDLPNAVLESKKIQLRNLNYKDYVEKHLGKFDGNCSQRSADVILKLLNKK